MATTSTPILLRAVYICATYIGAWGKKGYITLGLL